MDLQTLIILVVIGSLLAYLLNRKQSSANRNSNGQDANERPRYNDPNVQGSGSFGRDSDSESERQRNSTSRGTTEPNPRHDDPNLEGRGSFGRDKDNESRYSSRANTDEGNPSSRHDDANRAPSSNSQGDKTRQSTSERLRDALHDDDDDAKPHSRNNDPNVQGQGSFGKDKD